MHDAIGPVILGKCAQPGLRARLALHCVIQSNLSQIPYAIGNRLIVGVAFLTREHLAPRRIGPKCRCAIFQHGVAPQTQISRRGAKLATGIADAVKTLEILASINVVSGVTKGDVLLASIRP